MPKTPKSPRGEAQRHNPLADDYLPATTFKQRPAKRQKRDDAAGDRVIDSKQSQKILEIARELAEEADGENQERRPDNNPAFDFRLEDEPEEDTAQYDDDDAWGEEDEGEEVEVEVNDLDAFNRFFPTTQNPIVWPGEREDAQPSGGQGTDLAALILQKIAEHEAANPSQREVRGGGDPEDAVEIPEKVVEVYSKVGILMSRYKSGKLPKPFKVLPTIPAWETLLAITRPADWSKKYSPLR